jgi:membrane-bound lytic murein transglycosylase D
VEKQVLRTALGLAAVLLLAACGSAPVQPPQPVVPAPAQSGSPDVPRAEAPAPAPVTGPPSPFEGERREITETLRGLAIIDRTVPPDDVWQRIRNGYAVPNLESPLVQEKVSFFLARPEYLQRIFDRSRLYLYHIVEELEKRNMPTEIALLPMVESAFNPLAYSRAHASGLWQFIPGTGKRFELKQNWWYDGRRDIVASTTAALDYLQALYEMPPASPPTTPACPCRPRRATTSPSSRR